MASLPFPPEARWWCWRWWGLPSLLWKAGRVVEVVGTGRGRVLSKGEREARGSGPWPLEKSSMWQTTVWVLLQRLRVVLKGVVVAVEEGLGLGVASLGGTAPGGGRRWTGVGGLEVGLWSIATNPAQQTIFITIRRTKAMMMTTMVVVVIKLMMMRMMTII